LIAIFDYGSGNLRSALRAFETTGQQVVVTSDIQTLKSAQGLVIPGVGAFSACVTSLLKFKASEIIQYRVDKLVSGQTESLNYQIQFCLIWVGIQLAPEVIRCCLMA
jgi:imidazoleglycerol phosphate synthase glutamine amidotransferase subunit HisH